MTKEANAPPVILRFSFVVYTLTKNAAEAWTVGQRVYWHSVNARCTTNSTRGNPKIGVAVAAAANRSWTGNVRRNGVFQGAARRPNRRRWASLPRWLTNTDRARGPKRFVAEIKPAARHHRKRRA